MSKIGETKIEEWGAHCKKRNGVCDGNDYETCKYSKLCESIYTDETYFIRPFAWNLADPPRFTEAQMAFLRGWYAIGATWIGDSGLGLLFVIGIHEAVIGKFMADLVGIESAYPSEVKKVIDLAELFGKEGNYVSVP